MILRTFALALLIVNSATPANATYYLYWRDGSVTYVSDGMIVLALLGAAACLWLLYSSLDSSSSIAPTSFDLPEEVREPESVEHYDDMTARTRALKRKLDADTELAESYIKAARARAELDDLEDVHSESASGRTDTASR